MGGRIGHWSVTDTRSPAVAPFPDRTPRITTATVLLPCGELQAYTIPGRARERNGGSVPRRCSPDRLGIFGGPNPVAPPARREKLEVPVCQGRVPSESRRLAGTD